MTDNYVSSGRRAFLARIGVLLTCVAGAQFGWIGYRILKGKSRRTLAAKMASTIVAGNISEFPLGSVTPFPQGKFYLVHLQDGGFLALSRKCTHLGCSVPWVEEKREFICPCHGSVFDLHGAVVQSPAPRPLDLLHVRIEDGIVKVDTGQVTRRDHYNSSQAVRL